MSSGGYETFSYFNTGKVAQVVDVAGSGLDTITSTFAYDVAGNRTYEGYSGTVYSFYYPSGTTSSSLTLQSAQIIALREPSSHG
jgi:hypothetical protein